MTNRASDKRNFSPRLQLNDIQRLKSRSRMVKRLKYSLPSCAVIALFVLIGWPQVQHWVYGKKPTLAQSRLAPQGNNTATHPEYKGIDEKNQPYTITADHGVEISAQEIDFARPKMVMTLKSGDVVTLTSLSGRLNKVTNMMHLIGAVALTHSQGYMLETTQAWIDCKQGSAYGDNPIWGNGPTGAIEAKGFRLTQRGTKVSFIGGAQLLINTSKGDKK